MKRLVLFLILGLPLFLGNKGCEKAAGFEHPVVEKGVKCVSCHDDGRTKETRPAGHDASWKRTHGKWVKRYGLKKETTCLQCHKESHCTSCHQQEPPQDHTGHWRLRGHGVQVGLDRSRCFSCHRADLCQRCHSETRPVDHSALWGAPRNQHCLSCHFPLTSVGGEKCAVCHTGTPSHTAAPTRPSNSLHVTGANCRNCHSPLRHPDNGMSCTVCHQ